MGLERHGAPVLAQHPRRELGDRRVLRDEDVVLDAAGAPIGAPHPPGCVSAHLDPRFADEVADLPLRPASELADVEVRRDPEVALAARCEPDVALDARDAEGAERVAVEIEAHDVPLAAVVEERVRVECALGVLVARDRPVVELDRALLRDRAFELCQASGHLGRVVGVEHLDAQRGGARRLGESGAAEREVLQREPQRLCVRELALEQIERRLERRELLVLELELGEEILL